MLGFKNTIIISCALALIAMLTSSWLTFEYTMAKYEAQIAEQKQEAASTLATATKNVLNYERQIATLKDNIEVTHANNQKSINTIQADNRRLIAAAGGLRDPGRRTNSACTMPSATGSPTLIKASADSSRLSNEAQDFLLAFAADADRVVEQYESCQRWAAAIESNRHVEGPTVIKQAALTADSQKSYDRLAAHSDFYLMAHISP